MSGLFYFEDLLFLGEIFAYKKTRFVEAGF